MKVKVRCRQENRNEITAMLIAGGFVVSEDADYVFYENNYMPDYIIGKSKRDELEMVKFAEILFFESFGHEINMVAGGGTFSVSERIYQLEALLPPKLFIRISQSVIINKDNVKSISPGIGMRYHITMKNGAKVDVTRSYYYRFKSEVGI